MSSPLKHEPESHIIYEATNQMLNSQWYSLKAYGVKLPMLMEPKLLRTDTTHQDFGSLAHSIVTRKPATLELHSNGLVIPGAHHVRMDIVMGNLFVLQIDRGEEYFFELGPTSSITGLYWNHRASWNSKTESIHLSASAEEGNPLEFELPDGEVWADEGYIVVHLPVETLLFSEPGTFVFQPVEL